MVVRYVGRPRHVAVIGGGISGLSAAYFLCQADQPPDVTVLEGSPTIGGKLRLGHAAGIGVDLGAESVLARRPEALDLIDAVGLGDEIVHPVTTSAEIFSHGRLHPIPTGLVLGVPSEITALAAARLLSRRGLARVPLDLIMPRTRLAADAPVGGFLAARLGREVVERLVEPLLGGVYAGRADELSLAATMPELAEALRRERSVLRAAQSVRASSPATNTPVFAGLPGGVGRLPSAVAEASGAKIRVGATVRQLSRATSASADGEEATGWRLVVGTARDPEMIDADAVVLALPAHPAARLLADDVPAAARQLAAIDYASVAIVTLAYPRSVVPAGPRGSGFLVPPVEERTVKGVTFSSAKWRWVAAADPGTVLVRASIGRYRDEADLQRDDDGLVAAAAKDLADMIGFAKKPSDAIVTRWGGGLPQYAVGHRDRVRRIRAAVAELPGLAVCGAAYDGVGIPACIASARAAADAVLTAVEPARA